MLKNYTNIFTTFKRRKLVKKGNIFVIVKIVLLSKYWSDLAKSCSWLHCTWGGERRKKLPQASITYKSMMSKIGSHCTCSWDTGIKKEEFRAKSFEPIWFSLPFAGLLIRPSPTADEVFRGRSRSTSTFCFYKSADIISSCNSCSFSAIVVGELCENLVLYSYTSTSTFKK